MKISIDTREDSHEDLRKVIKMLQHIIGDSQEVFTNQPSVPETPANPFANIFGDSSSVANNQSTVENAPILPSVEASASQPEAIQSSSESTEDLFAELFSEEDIKKMDSTKAPEDEDEEVEIGPKTNDKKKKYDIEFY